MTARQREPLRLERLDEPAEFPAPSPEGMELLRQLFPPVRRKTPRRTA